MKKDKEASLLNVYSVLFNNDPTNRKKVFKTYIFTFGEADIYLIKEIIEARFNVKPMIHDFVFLGHIWAKELSNEDIENISEV